MNEPINYLDVAWAWLKSRGFKKKKAHFYKDMSNVVVIIDFQKSDFSESYFINFAVWLKDVSSVADPGAIKENQCHIKTRLERLLPEFFEVIRMLADRGRLNANERSELDAQFPGVFGKELEEKIEAFSSVEVLKKTYKDGFLQNAMVRKEAKDFLLS